MIKSIIILASTTVLYSAVHSLTASNTIKRLIRRWLGPASDRWYRFVYNFWAGISFLPILWLLWYLPDRVIYRIPMPWVLFTTIIQLVGVLIILIGIQQAGTLSFLGIQQVIGQNHSSDEPLVVSGLYAYIRHPLYTGGLLFIWPAPLLSQNLLTLFIVITIYLVIGARLEENRLLQEFGDEYRCYQKEVPMLFPRILQE
jgi:protein-S-isoprenylcysteine O-methyltransferase Ste14